MNIFDILKMYKKTKILHIERISANDPNNTTVYHLRTSYHAYSISWCVQLLTSPKR